MTDHRDFFAALAVPIDQSDIKVRKGPGGRDLPYITARTVMNRLDEVAAPEGWWDSYIPLKNSVICILSIRLPDGQVLTKSDAGARSQTGDEGVDDMGAFSDALKRAGVKFGIARELYRDGVASFVLSPEEAQRRGILLHRVPGMCTADLQSEPDSGGASCAAAQDATAPAPPRSVNAVPVGRQPVTGKELWGWAERLGTATGKDVIEMVLAWGKAHAKSRVVDWDVGLVSECFAATAAKLDAQGLVNIPAEARSQMPAPPVAGQSAPAKVVGPLTIDPKDPLLKQKLRIIATTKELVNRLLGKGVPPTEAQAMAWLGAQVVDMGLPAIKDLRNYANRKNVMEIADRLDGLLVQLNQLS